MNMLLLLISFFASIVGSICGIGGGVIIKPVLDTFGVLDVKAISFLSNSTVFSMAAISVLRLRNNNTLSVNMPVTLPLAVGGALGGIVGKTLFTLGTNMFAVKSTIGLVQSFLMVLITTATYIYTINKSHIQTHEYKHTYFCFLTGLILGIISTFLGIGGGPINLIILSYFFSMDTKTAALNSLFIILLSQFTSVLQTLLTSSVRDISPLYITLMVLGGVCGGLLGCKINRRISVNTVDKLFKILMIIIILISIRNVYLFGSIANLWRYRW